ncbi:histidine kinase [Kribbella sp. NPDC051952]|uniref:sensor histidine kinase n=1 Tax=Kribbella sp. NPDC051952 TaxID=3154851 RepID=UPI00342435BF
MDQDDLEQRVWPRRLGDVCLTLLAYLVAAATLTGELTSTVKTAPVWIVLDVVAGVAGPPLLMIRRQRPILVVALLLAAATVTTTAAPAAAIASVIVRRRFQQALVVAGFALAAVTINLVVRQGIETYWPIYGVLVLIGAVELGLFLRLRLRLSQEAARRARRAEAEQKTRIEHARRSERLRIARDMHDVLAHRISLLSMHAGALAFRPDAPAADVAAAAEVIRGASHDILTDLQKVIGVLRDDTQPPEPDLRPPGLQGIGELIDDAVRSGQPVQAGELPSATIPEATGRTAYRVVQEGLTNARKHAPGRVVRIEFDAAEELTVVISNELAISSGLAVPGAGLGLLGLRERLDLLGGRLSYGQADGMFRLIAWLPLAS